MAVEAMRRQFILGAAVLCVSGGSLIAYAQSGTKGSANRGQGGGTTQRGDDSEQSLALRGYCPVCVVELKEWVKGTPQVSVDFDGQTYLFPSEEQREMFLNNPEKYVPALGGDCTVCKVEHGERVPGSVQYSVLHAGRLYLFPGEKQKQMFMENPSKYEDADLAAGGRCTVCRVEMQKDVPDNREFTVFHNGMRYRFPGAEQKQMFLENPAKYQID